MCNTNASATGIGNDGVKIMELNLTAAEMAILRKMIEIYLSDLRMEIVDTEEKDFREELKQEEVVLKKILGMLS